MPARVTMSQNATLFIGDGREWRPVLGLPLDHRLESATETCWRALQDSRTIWRMHGQLTWQGATFFGYSKERIREVFATPTGLQLVDYFEAFGVDLTNTRQLLRDIAADPLVRS